MKMLVKRNFAVITALILAIGTFLAVDVSSFAAGGDTVVYITKTGEKYHSSGCSSLSKSKIETTLKNAVDKGYEPCKKCKPPKLDATSTSATTTAPATKATAATVNNAAAPANAVVEAVEALKTYKGNTKEFNAYTYYLNNVDLQTAIGPDGDKLLKHYTDFGKAEGRVAK